MLSLPYAALVASGLGTASHLGFFIHGEHNRNGIHILRAAVILPSLSYLYLIYYADFTRLQAVLFTTAVFWSYTISLYSSMLIYRGFFHHLGRFPGPPGAKYTKFWHAFAAADFNWYKTVNKLHSQYGDFVRTGPNELSIADPASIELVHGPKSRCTKSAWYDLAFPQQSLQLVRDKATHDKRRRVAWERAFSTKALRGYDSTVIRHADELVSGIASFSGKPVNVSKWFNYFTADTISALGFGEPFNMLKDRKDHWSITLLQEGSSHLSTLGPIPWILTLLNHFPWLQAANLKAIKWSIAQVEKRKDRKVENGVDIMHWLLDPLEPMSSNPKIETGWLHSDARLAIVAGTDTSTAALSYLFLELCKNPSIVEKIREELIEHNFDDDFSVHELQNCKYLNSVIDETLRLHPPVPDGVYRLTPPEGLQIGDTFIPGGVTIINPVYTIQRSSTSFVRPEEFIPERWTTQSELILNKKALIAFGIGPYGCVGKQLALNEIRTVVAKLLLGFDVNFAEGEDGRRILDETKDYFVLATVNIVRDRERDVPHYNEFRRLFHLKPWKSFTDLVGKDRPELAQKLATIYDNDIQKIDLLVGCLCEPLPNGFGFTDTAFCAFTLMAKRRLKSDRFIATEFDNKNSMVYPPDMMAWVQDNGMKEVLCRRFPKLRAPLKDVKNPFAPWTKVDRSAKNKGEEITASS